MISVIIVNYHAHQELFACLKTLVSTLELEIIVVDNDEMPSIKTELSSQFPTVKYLSSPTNVGFGPACNLGAASATGKYYFFLNPDTLVLNDAIPVLAAYLDNHPPAAVTTPLLLYPDLKPYPLVGSHNLGPLQGIFALSFINRLWPHNPISENYWIRTANLTKPTKIDVAPGTALMIRAVVFKQVGGFDPRIFLYFEESDLCRRVEKLGCSIFLLPQAKVIHYWAKSTLNSPRTNRIFISSRFYYFKKHFGLLPALLVEFICRLSLRRIRGIK